MPQTTMLPARLVFGLSLLAGIAGAQTFPVSAPVAGRSVGQTGLASLSDVQVLDEYQAAAKALEGQATVPSDDPLRLASIPMDDGVTRFAKARAEILCRGTRMVPALVELLNAEVPQNRRGVGDRPPMSLSGNTMDLMVQLDDPRPVPTLVEILDGFDGKASRAEQKLAQGALAQLTRCSFVRLTPRSSDYDRAVQSTKAVEGELSPDPHDIARRYREWLAGEGKDPAQWMAISRRRAHELLGSANLDDVYCAAAFLNANGDNQTEITVTRLTELIGGMKPGKKRDQWLYGGQPIPGHITQWVSFLADHGPLARPGAQVIIRVHRFYGPSTMYRDLEHVGGMQILAYLCEECLPRIDPQVTRIRSDPATPKGFASDDPRSEWLQCDFYCSLAIDRWAGRRFASNTERRAWWQANMDKSDEQRLREGLPTLAAQADGVDPKDVWARSLLRMIAPDFPDVGSNFRHQRRLLWIEQYHDTMFLAATQPSRVSAVPWVREHAEAFTFDPATGTLRLAK